MVSKIASTINASSFCFLLRRSIGAASFFICISISSTDGLVNIGEFFILLYTGSAEMVSISLSKEIFCAFSIYVISKISFGFFS
jgi:hypothetical protein